MAPFFMRGRLHKNHNISIINKRLRLQTKMKKNRMKGMQERFERLKTEMEEISEEQKGIREGQRQVREKFEAIEFECEQLKKETNFIIEQSARTQVKLVLMFRIMKAREENDLATAANLTRLLGSLHKRALKKLESLRKSAIAAYSVERNKTQTPRHVLRRMSKENKKPPLAVNNQSSVIGTRRKSGARRVKRV
ncbi:hypothetical protein POUND7_017080 [Theobroma cacao]